MSDQVFSVAPPINFAYIGFKRRFIPYVPKRGDGYFSSSFPEYLVVVEGVPAVGEIRVLVRSSQIKEADGFLVAKTMSDNTGQWRVDGLDPTMRYDVVCRVNGYRDIVFSDLTPKV